VSRYGTLVALLVAVAACQRGPTPEQARELEQARAAVAQRDTMLQEMAQTARFIGEITAELAKVQSRERLASAKIQSESPRTAQRDTLLWQVRDVVARVQQGEARLREARRRINALTATSDSLKTQLQGTVTQLEQALAAHRETIAALNAEIEDLRHQNEQLAAKTVALADTVSAMSRAYYVIGTKEDLVRRGIVVEEGGSRVLFVFGKRGKTLQPVRDLPVSEFNSIDSRSVTEIPLPDPSAEYRIASRQSPEYLATPPDDKGLLRGTAALRIAEPDKFWLPSRFLIIVKSGA
jgi:PBP1b-binding outer membrane lipoprotein LpoB